MDRYLEPKANMNQWDYILQEIVIISIKRKRENHANLKMRFFDLKNKLDNFFVS